MRTARNVIIALLAAWTAIGTAHAMNYSSIPTKVPTTWGSTAPGSNITCPMPIPSQISITPGRASWSDGFPPVTFLPPNVGGVPPSGQDFNGVLCQLSQWTRWQGAGAQVLYDPSYSTAIGGYPAWAMLGNASTPGCVWISTVDGNTSDPDTGGANWINTCTPAVGGVLTGNLPNPGMAPGVAAANVGTLGGSLAGTLPNATIAASGVGAGSYVNANITVAADGRVTAAASNPPTIPVPQFNTASITATGSFTFTTPSNSTTATAYKMTLTGPGGGGANISTGGGGGAGATCTATFSGIGPSVNLSGFIGPGPAATATGSASSFSDGPTTWTAGPGGGTTTATDGAGGTASSNCDLRIAGGDGSTGSSSTAQGQGGASFWGGGGASSGTGARAGQAYGSGGGAGATGGAGAQGVAVFEWVL
jgi:hypothetical protein